MAQFKQHRIWHSFLKNASPIVIKFKGPTMESTLNVGETIVFFEVRGDPTDKYYYVVENEAIAEEIDDAPHREWLKCTFDGMKEGATINYTEAGGATNASRTQAGPRPGQPIQVDSFSTGNIVDDFGLCVDRAKRICEGAFPDFDPVDPAVVQAMAATLYINWSYTKFTKPLDTAMAAPKEDPAIVQEIKDMLENLPLSSGKAHDGRALKTTLAKIADGVEGEHDAKAFEQFRAWLVIETEAQSNVDEELTDDLPF